MTTSQPFSSFAAQFDQADEPVGGKWTDRFNTVRSGVEKLHKGLQLLNKINNERKRLALMLTPVQLKTAALISVQPNQAQTIQPLNSLTML